MWGQMDLKRISFELGQIHSKEGRGVEFRKWSLPIYGSQLINAYIYKILMQSIDDYFKEIYYIATTAKDQNTPSTLRQTLKKDLVKCMMIGSVFTVMLRFCNQYRFYLFKDYVKASLFGSVFGMAYSPIYLSKKIDTQK